MAEFKRSMSLLSIHLGGNSMPDLD